MADNPLGTPAPQPGDVVAGRYKLTRILGAGAMGTVFEATADGQPPVALKVLNVSAAGDAGDAARFRREALAGQSVPSPHVLNVVDAGEDPRTGCPFIVMPLLLGADLGALLKRVGPLSPSVAIRIACQAAQGLVAAHRAGIVHRDVKPSNIFLHTDGEAVTVKVLDFGVAKTLLAEESLTATGEVLGSPLYLSPEQARSAKSVDERTDVWGLGVTLYAALAGQPPWQGRAQSVSQLLVKVATEDVPPLQDAAPWVPPRLVEIVHGALVRDLDRRCPSMRAFLDALEPRAGGTLLLKPSMLVAATPELRSQRPAAARIPGAWSDIFESPARTPPEPRETDKNGLRVVGDGIELTRLLGRGGMGAVYEGRRKSERVAVKVMLDEQLPALKPDALKRFIREARASMAIQSDHVVKVLAADTDPRHGTPYIVMEFLEGRDVDQLVKEHGALHHPPVVRLFAQACQGLKAAHDLGIIHRDIKPANLFVHQVAAGCVTAKVCDFGVAKTVLSETGQAATALTRTGGMLGSPMYMSPEQANDSKVVDLRTDIWSLGAALYEALSGQRMWDAPSVNAVLIALCTREPPPLRERAPWLPKGLCHVVHKALQREPGARYMRADEMAAALEPYAQPGSAVRWEELRPAVKGEPPPVVTTPVTPMVTAPAAPPVVAPAPSATFPVKWVGAGAGLAVVLGVLAWVVSTLVAGP
jgi:serine/threonine protein kinase